MQPQQKAQQLSQRYYETMHAHSHASQLLPGLAWAPTRLPPHPAASPAPSYYGHQHQPIHHPMDYYGRSPVSGGALSGLCNSPPTPSPPRREPAGKLKGGGEPVDGEYPPAMNNYTAAPPPAGPPYLTQHSQVPLMR